MSHIAVMFRCCPSSLGHMCYLALAGGFIYTLQVSPPRDGDPRAISKLLKGPTMSFLHLVSKHLLLKLNKGSEIPSMLVNFRGCHVVLLSKLN